MSDHAGFMAFLRRVLRAAGRRVADADPEDLAEMLALRSALDDAITGAVAGMRRRGVSWTEIARATGTTRQAARQRWADKVALSADQAPISAA